MEKRKRKCIKENQTLLSWTTLAKLISHNVTKTIWYIIIFDEINYFVSCYSFSSHLFLSLSHPQQIVYPALLLLQVQVLIALYSGQFYHRQVSLQKNRIQTNNSRQLHIFMLMFYKCVSSTTGILSCKVHLYQNRFHFFYFWYMKIRHKTVKETFAHTLVIYLFYFLKCLLFRFYYFIILSYHFIILSLSYIYWTIFTHF